MKYAPIDTRIDVANAQHAVVHALDTLRSALSETDRIPDVANYAIEGDTDIAAWLYLVSRIRAHVDSLAWITAAVEQIDVYAGDDEYGPRERLRGPLVASANPSAPDPTTAGTAAFGVSRSITPDNPFADVFAARGTFGHVAQ